MDFFSFLFFGGLIAGVITAIIAGIKGYGNAEKFGWFLAGLFFSLLAVIVVLIVPRGSNNDVLRVSSLAILIAFILNPAPLLAGESLQEQKPSAAPGSAEGLLLTTQQEIQDLINQIDKQKECPPEQPIFRYTAPKGSNQQVIQQAIGAVKQRLKDPYSARFRNVHIGKERHRPVYGEVNAKNGYGGYTGYTLFVYVIINGTPHVTFDE